MNILQASRQSGVSVDMIRFYEKKGLIRPARKANGYRDFSDQDVVSIVMIRQYNCLGIELSEIKDIMQKRTYDRLAGRLSASADELEKQARLLLQRIEFARETKQMFELLKTPDNWDVFATDTFWFCQRDAQHARAFAALYESYCCRPAMRIQPARLKESFAVQDQGIILTEPPMTELPVIAYAPGRMYRTVLRTTLADARDVLEKVCVQMKERGYASAGDGFLTQISGTDETGLAAVCISLIIQ